MEKKTTLHLTLTKEPFDVMQTGEKKIEFRKPTDWIKSRFYDKKGNVRVYDLVKFTNGYGSHRPNFTAEFNSLAFASSDYVLEYSNGLKVPVEEGMYCIGLGKIIERKNIKSV